MSIDLTRILWLNASPADDECQCALCAGTIPEHVTHMTSCYGHHAHAYCVHVRVYALGDFLWNWRKDA